MALVSDGFELTVTLLDNGLNQSNLRYDLVAADAAAAATAATTIIGALSAVTQAEVKGYSIAERFIEDDLAIPISNVQIENIAAVTCQLASSPLKKVTVKIPAASPAIFVALSGPGSNVIDTLDSDLQDYIEIWKETGALATISDGEFIEDGLASVLSGKRIHRQSSRG